jgi:fatty-acyl-CoA synthase
MLVRDAASITVGSLFAAQVRLFPARVAIEADGRPVSYAELGGRVNRTAAALAQAGIGHGDRVAILSENRAEFLEAQLAVAKLGAILACQNWRLTPSETQYCLDLVEPKLVLVSPRHAGKLTAITLANAIVCEFGAAWEMRLAAAAPDEPPAVAVPEDPLAILYTSGTTGLPKGAVLTHRSELARIFIMGFDLGMRPGDSSLCWPPLYHMGGMEQALLALLTGGRVFIIDGFDVERIAETIERHRFGWISIMPGSVGRLIEVLERRGTKPAGLTACGVMPDLIPPRQVRRITELLGASYCNSFGATETGTPPLSGGWLPPGHLPLDFAKTPSPNCEIRLVDEADRDVPDGETGELAMRGPTLFSGYWRNEAATATDFRNGWFHMGDLFRRRPDGRFDFVDRAKYLIKSGGENIYPAEIERVLVSHPGVLDAVVVRRADPTWGEIPIALVVAADPALSPADLAALCRRDLAGYKQPKQIRLVPAERITRSTTGKVQRAALEQWVAGGPETV